MSEGGELRDALDELREATDPLGALLSEAEAKAILTSHAGLREALESTLHTLGLMADAYPLGSATRNTLEDECASIRAALANQ